MASPLAPPQIQDSESFESFFTNVPIIASAEFEIESPPPDLQAGPGRVAVTNLEVTLQLDGTNYSLSRAQNKAHATRAWGGSFKGVLWKLDLKDLVEFDPSMNPPGTISNPVLMDSVNHGTIRRLINFGIQNMIPGSAVWDASRTSFVAKSEANSSTGKEQNPLLVQFAYQNGVPQSATVKVDSLGTFLVDYSYDPSFHGGHLPNMFACYFDSRDDRNRLFTLRIKKLLLQTDHLDPLALDFHQSMRGQFSSSAFWSNGVRYNLGGFNMLPQPMLTAEEATARRDAMIKVHHPTFVPAARTVFLLLLAIQPIILILFLKKHNQQNKQQ